jgi:hypothetical protein
MNQIDRLIGKESPEEIRLSAVYSCMELFVSRGWNVGQSNNMCKFDVLCFKNDKVVKVQVRSSIVLSARGFPMFKTARILFNTKRAIRTNFISGDFDYWYFYSFDKRKWLVPFSEMTNRSTVSMEKYSEYIV